jgi:hypothetical protein
MGSHGQRQPNHGDSRELFPQRASRRKHLISNGALIEKTGFPVVTENAD